MPSPEDEAAQEAAANYVMPFGEYQGQSIRDIMDMHGRDGARYLARAVTRQWINPRVNQAIQTFLEIPWVERLVYEATGDEWYGPPPEDTENPAIPEQGP